MSIAGALCAGHFLVGLLTSGDVYLWHKDTNMLKFLQGMSALAYKGELHVPGKRLAGSGSWHVAEVLVVGLGLQRDTTNLDTGNDMETNK